MFQNYSTMKKLLTLFAIALAVVVSSCSKFDDSAIWDKLNEQEQTLNDHEKRIAALEELCKQMNTNINALQTIVEALEKKDYVTNVSPVREDGEIVGYTISFANSDTITIYNGKDGKDGVNGQDGQNGYTPQIGVMKDTDGIYYWTLDGEWLLDDNGNKIKAVGEDGRDGQDGTDGTNGSNGSNGQDGQDGEDGTDGRDGVDGKDGITPQLKIEDGYWFISYDNGATWTQLGRATGEDGKDGADGEDGKDGADGEDGKDGQNGADGKDGQDGDSMFQSVSQDENYVYFTLADGTVIKIAKGNGSNDQPNEDDIIDFKDLAVKSALLNISPKIDTNGDGEISYKEAAIYKGRISISGNKNIRSFKEFQHFTNVSMCYFYGSNELFEVILPNGLDSILDYAFGQKDINDKSSRTKITNISIPVGCKWIGKHAFDGLSVLADKINFPEGLEYIGDGAFYDVPFTSINLPNSVKHIGATAFHGYYQWSKLQEFKFPEALISCGNNIFKELPPTIYWDAINFQSCQLSRCGSSSLLKIVIFGDKVEFIPAELCYDLDQLTEIILPASVKTIGENAFYSCSGISNVEFPEGLELINESAFYRCTSLQNITIPDKVQIIGSSAFSGCSKVTSITIGKSVEIINDYAFSSTNPTQIYCKAQHAPYIGASALPTTAIIYVPRESVNEYREAWSDYATKIMGYDFE